MNYTPSLTALPATGIAFSSMWLFLGGLTILMLGLALMRLAPKKQA